MVFSIRVWHFSIEFHLLDIDPTDRDIEIGLKVKWSVRKIEIGLRVAW